MQVIKYQDPIGSDWLWQFQDEDCLSDLSNGPQKTWLVFGVYYLDTFDRDPISKIKELLSLLENEIRDWNQSYPWSEFNGINMELEKTVQGVPFILGNICVEDDVIQEESIVVALLQKFTLNCRIPQLFVKICDTSGDFLLAEVSDCIPEEYQYPISVNRLWIHEGKFKMIPREYYAYRGLKPEESLNFLREKYYKLMIIDGIHDKISRSITNKYPRELLTKLQRLQLVIEDTQVQGILSVNPQLISFALKNLINEEIQVSEEVTENSNNSQLKEFLVPERFVDILSLFLDSKDLKKEPHNIPLYCGRAITAVIDSLLKKSIIKIRSNVVKYPSVHDTTFFRLHEFPVAVLQNPFKMDEGNDSLQDLIERLDKIFDRDEDIRNMSNPIEKDDGSDYSDDNDEDIRRFFENENIDIDEDDFFEFFLNDALKMDKDSIEALRS